MGEQGVPNLEGMDEQEARHFLTELLPRLSPEEEYEIRHEDYVMEIPQSGERIRGCRTMREFQEAYPNPPTTQLRRVIVRDGKMFGDTRYYAEPFEAPEWRARWVERIDP